MQALLFAAIALGLALGIVAVARGFTIDSSSRPHLSTASSIVATSTATRAELEARLRALAKCAPPDVRRIQAMCYALIAVSSVTDVRCTFCGRRTLFFGSNDLLARLQARIQAIRRLPHGVDLTLDTKLFCSHCHPERSTTAYLADLRYALADAAALAQSKPDITLASLEEQAHLYGLHILLGRAPSDKVPASAILAIHTDDIPMRQADPNMDGAMAILRLPGDPRLHLVWVTETRLDALQAFLTGHDRITRFYGDETPLTDLVPELRATLDLESRPKQCNTSAPHDESPSPPDAGPQ